MGERGSFIGFWSITGILLGLGLVLVTPANAADCNTNGLEDACDLDCGTAGGACDLPGCGLSPDCDTNSVPDECDLADYGSGCSFPRILFENTTTGEDSRFVGPPDDVFWGLGGQIVTFEWDCGQVIDGPGPDITVYEIDGGVAEFNTINVLVSADGVTFFSVKSSETAAVNIPGDDAHGSNSFARSYDLGPSGLTAVTFVRIDGNGTGASGASTGFDMDAIGAVNLVGLDCDANGVLDACETLADCDADGLPDCLTLAAQAVPDCNVNDVPDSCDTASMTSADCNTNTVPDECEVDCNTNLVPDDCDITTGTSQDCDTSGTPDECDLAAGGSGCAFPMTLSENTTTSPDFRFVGPPDDVSWGLGGQVVTYDLDCALSIDGPGPDITVYEIDASLVEFNTIDVLVSSDGNSFVSIKSTETAAVNIPGDEAHGSNSFARSYDYGGTGLNGVRFIRIDGNGTGASGGGTGFDLDAIGLINRLGLDCDGNSVLDACEVFDDCDNDGLSDSCATTAGLVGDCNANIVPDACEAQDDCDGNSVQDICDLAVGAQGCSFPDLVASNTTGGSDASVLGPPDDLGFQLSTNQATLEFGCGFVVDQGGPDFNVYEADSGQIEFASMQVLVSDDDLTYVDVTASAGPVVDIPGDELHGDPLYARSYDLAGSNLRSMRYVRLQGTSSANGGFELDAIGAIHRVGRDCDGSGTLDVCEPLGDCDANLLPDSCELIVDPDCNMNTTLDECDIAGSSNDVDMNAQPDECQPDCNGNLVPDEFEVAQGTGTECNGNGVLDECDITSGLSNDCNLDGIPDECPACPPVEVAFIMDVSTSMDDEGAALCNGISQITSQLADQGISAQSQLMGITGPGSGIYSCLTEGVVTNWGTSVPGTPPPGNETLGDCPGGNEVAEEDWGRAVSVTAANKPWLLDTVRLVVPLSDEGPWCGDPVSDPGVDRDSITHAIAISGANGVIVSPVAASGSSGAVQLLAQNLSDGTGGDVLNSSEILTGLVTIIQEACDSATDCNANNVPDSCELAAGTAQDCDFSGVLDECEMDCNNNGFHDACDIASETSADVNVNTIPDECEIVWLTLDDDDLNWTAADGATGYDVLRGNLGVLRATGGDFTLSTDDCVSDDLAALTTPHSTLADPPPGEVEWFLVRAVQAVLDLGYETFFPSQVELRDAEIAASPTPCP